MRVSFVCSGNICRSPSAEVVMRHLAEQAGVRIEVESAGTGGWHVGDAMDSRSAAALQARGLDPTRHRARQFERSDFARLDLVVALDATHARALKALAPTPADAAKVVLLGTLGTAHLADPDVPDPYYGGPFGFEDVLDRVEDGCRGLLARAS